MVTTTYTNSTELHALEELEAIGAVAVLAPGGRDKQGDYCGTSSDQTHRSLFIGREDPCQRTGLNLSARPSVVVSGFPNITPIFSRIWLMKTAAVLDFDSEPQEQLASYVSGLMSKSTFTKKDLLREIGNISRYDTFMESPNDVNVPKRRQELENFRTSHDYTVEVTFFEESFFK